MPRSVASFCLLLALVAGSQGALAHTTAVRPLTRDAGALRVAGAEAAPLDLSALEQRLRDTDAIGIFTKITLQNQVDNLVGNFRAYHEGDSGESLEQLRQQYEVLLMKVISLLQDDDPELASAVYSSREAIWGVLVDPKKFATI